MKIRKTLLGIEKKKSAESKCRKCKWNGTSASFCWDGTFPNLKKNVILLQNETLSFCNCKFRISYASKCLTCYRIWRTAIKSIKPFYRKRIESWWVCFTRCVFHCQSFIYRYR